MNEKLLEKIIEVAMYGKGEDKPANDAEHPFEIGEAYFIRTVTYHFVGRVKKIVGKFLILDEASWVADSGRFHEALEKGELSEIEYMQTAFLNIDTITDATPWKLKNLPTESK